MIWLTFNTSYGKLNWCRNLSWKVWIRESFDVKTTTPTNKVQNPFVSIHGSRYAIIFSSDVISHFEIMCTVRSPHQKRIVHTVKRHSQFETIFHTIHPFIDLISNRLSLYNTSFYSITIQTISSLYSMAKQPHKHCIQLTKPGKVHNVPDLNTS